MLSIIRLSGSKPSSSHEGQNKNYEIGENILLIILDKWFDPPYLLGFIQSKTDEGYYQLGTIAGILDSQYISI